MDHNRTHSGVGGLRRQDQAEADTDTDGLTKLYAAARRLTRKETVSTFASVWMYSESSGT